MILNSQLVSTLNIVSMINLDELIRSFLVIIITTAILVTCYRYYEFEWPERYFGPEDKENIFISINPIYYFCFRILPVFILTFSILSTILKANIKVFNTVFLGAAIGSIYALITDVRALKDLFTNNSKIEKYRNITAQYVLHFSVAILLISSSTLAGYLSTFESSHWLFPNIEGLIDNIWASFISILLSFVLYNIIRRPKETSIDEVIDKSVKKLSTELVVHIEKRSKEFDADPNLVKAICIAESIERPKWIRFFENLFARLGMKGTFGIMQVASSKPISDKESINISIMNYFQGTSKMDLSSKMMLVKSYNNDSKYLELVEEIQRYLVPIELHE